MTVQLPKAMESAIEAAVRSGRFASVDDAMARAAQLLIHEIEVELSSPTSQAHAQGDPLLGCMRDHAQLMDEVVADAYRERREDKWREVDL